MKDLDEDTKHVRLSPQVYGTYAPVVKFIFLLFIFTRLFLYL